jgi:hypothetical protein
LEDMPEISASEPSGKPGSAARRGRLFGDYHGSREQIRIDGEPALGGAGELPLAQFRDAIIRPLAHGGFRDPADARNGCVVAEEVECVLLVHEMRLSPLT